MGALQRRQYLINKRFQLRWTGLITSVGALIATLFVMLLWMSLGEQDTLLSESIHTDQELRNAAEDVAILLLNMPETTDEEAQGLRAKFTRQAERHRAVSKLRQEMIARNDSARTNLIGAVVLLAAALFVWGIFVTHKIAGPLHVIRLQLAHFREHKKLLARPLRRNDEFQDVYDELRSALGGESEAKSD